MEREISLKNLFWKLLFGWRYWFIGGIISSLLMLGIGYKRDTIDYNKAMKNSLEQDVILTKEEEKVIEEAEEIQNKIDKLQTYIQESVLMNLDAYHKDVLVLQYYVDSNYTINYSVESKKDYLNELIVAYCNYVKSEKMAETVKQGLNVEISISYINELLTADSNGGIIRIIISYKDQESLENLESLIKKALEEQEKNFSEIIGSHSLKFLSAEVTMQSDRELAKQQREQYELLNLYNIQLSTLKGGMTAEQLNVLGGEMAESVEEENSVVVPSVFNVKYAFFGFVMGVIGICFCISLKILFSSHIQEAEDLCMYEIRLLGKIEGESKKKKLLGFIDVLLLKLKSRNKKPLDGRQQCQNICLNLELICNKEGKSKVYLTGSQIQKIDKEWLEALQESLKAVGVFVFIGESIIDNVISLKNAAEIGSIVLFEKVGSCKHEELKKEIKIAKENGICIIGGIAYE